MLVVFWPRAIWLRLFFACAFGPLFLLGEGPLVLVLYISLHFVVAIIQEYYYLLPYIYFPVGVLTLALRKVF